MLLALGLLASLAIAAPGGYAPDAVRAAVREVLEDARYQRELPDLAPPTDLPLPAPAAPRELPDAPRVGAVAHLASWLLWIVLAAAVLGALLWALRQVRGGDARQVEGEEDAAPGQPAPVTAQPLDEAERLAGQGHYAEAIHRLLLAAIGELAQRRALDLASSHTSREVLRAAPLGEAGREALGHLVRAVEWSRFGGAPAGADDYARCLSHFRRFVAECDPAGPAPAARAG